MPHDLSILIPTYNNACLELVKSLQAQASAMPGLHYEIIVADDGSTYMESVKTNRGINAIPHCRYIERERNTGRAVIRNFLAQQSAGEWLLFIDSDMVVRNASFVASYISTIHAQKSTGSPIIYGGYTIAFADHDALSGNLRYIFEQKNKQNADYRLRQAHPYHDFHTSNFIVSRDIMLQHPLDERFRHYGYEDVLWGKTLQDHGIRILHVDNPLSFEHFETNKAFLDKTEEGLHTLYQFRDELRGYSTLIKHAEKVCRLPFVKWCVTKAFPLASLHIRSTLMGNGNNIMLFNIYKLMYFIRLGA